MLRLAAHRSFLFVAFMALLLVEGSLVCVTLRTNQSDPHFTIWAFRGRKTPDLVPCSFARSVDTSCRSCFAGWGLHDSGSVMRLLRKVHIIAANRGSRMIYVYRDHCAMCAGLLHAARRTSVEST